MTLKKIAFLTPRPGLSQAAFEEYWRDSHGPLVSRSPGYATYRRRYVQNQVLDNGLIGRRLSFAGVAEFWLPSDNEEDFSATSIYRDRIRVDEERFIDFSATVSLTASETILLPGHGDCKLWLLSRRNPQWETGAFAAFWTNTVAAQLLQDPRFGPLLRGWQLNLSEAGSSRLPGAVPAADLGWDTLQILWFASRDAMFLALASGALQQTWQPLADHAAPINEPVSFVTRERVFFDQGQAVDPA